MDSHSDSDSDPEDEVEYSSGEEDCNSSAGTGWRTRKRITRIRLTHGRKKSRSVDEQETMGALSALGEHTGLSPRMNRMDLVLPHSMWSPDAFFLEDGIETFSMDRNDPRAVSVGEIYHELELRLKQAAMSASLSLESPAVRSMKKQVALRAAEIESKIFESVGPPGTTPYRNAVFSVVRWIQNASEAELRSLLENQSGVPGDRRVLDIIRLPVADENHMIMDAQ